MSELSTIIGDYMTSTPATVNADLSLADAQDRMTANNLRHLPVVNDDGHLTGIISNRDIVVALAFGSGEAKDIKVADAMSPVPFSCGPKAHLDAVAKEMEANRYGSAVIVEDGKPIGVFTTTDALYALRQFAAGKALERELTPTHVTEGDEERGSVPRPRMPSSGSTPTPNQGKFRP